MKLWYFRFLKITSDIFSIINTVVSLLISYKQKAKACTEGEFFLN